MSINTFDGHISEIGTDLQRLREIIDSLDGKLKRHTHNAYSGLMAGDFAGRQVDKVQYDNAITSIDNLLNTWLAAGHGTNIDAYLYETP